MPKWPVVRLVRATSKDHLSVATVENPKGESETYVPVSALLGEEALEAAAEAYERFEGLDKVLEAAIAVVSKEEVQDEIP